ncbi:hypothetical protein [Rhizobium sp. BK176]|uniref:hypothetical protein n=1 Tax=Rhizobium sp. BK176 TaxID=2587071 RepID=UPI002168876C|nr:hypothetical protein [Rhizobium sp. BK176]MCS4089448.1 hypothetical protein [Rhizobium sp. BK176]
MSHRAGEAIVDTVNEVAVKLRPGRSASSSGFRFTRDDGVNEGLDLVHIEEEKGNGKWSLGASSHMGRYWFTVRQYQNDIPHLICSGELSSPTATGFIGRVRSVHHTPANFRDLTRLATALRAGKEDVARKASTSDAIAPVLALDGGVPGEHSRRLHRLLFEDAAARAAEWAVPLLRKVTQVYVGKGLRWGEAAAHWSMPAEGHFPSFRSPTTTSCLLPHPDGISMAMLFRDAQPNIATETYVALIDAQKGTFNLLPIGEGSVEDIEEFMKSGGVPALTCAFETGEVRATERAMSSKVLESFCDHVGEAWLVMNDAPLYAAEGEMPMVTHDFTPFGEIAPWTRAGKRLVAMAVEKQRNAQAKTPAP